MRSFADNRLTDNNWLNEADKKVCAVLADYKEDEETVCVPGDQAVRRAYGLLAMISQRYSSLVLPGVSVSNYVIDLSWTEANEKLEFLVTDKSIRIAYWDGKVSRNVDQEEACRILARFERTPAHA